MDPNLIIDDDYITGVGHNCLVRGQDLDEIFEKYTTILDGISKDAVLAGAVSEALVAYISCASTLKGHLDEISDNINNCCKSFINGINQADDYIF